MTTHEADAAYVISALREGLDYYKVGEAMFTLLCLGEEYLEAQDWPQCANCCDTLERLAEDPELQRTADIDTTYVRGISQFYRGTSLLCRNRLEDAVRHFSSSQQLFHKASALHSEGVALLALGLTYQKLRRWTETLKALQCSLTIFRKLQDKLQVDVRDRLAQVRLSLKKDLDRSTYPPQPTVVTAPPSTAKSKGKIIPIVARIAAGEPILADENIEEYTIIDEGIAERVDFGLRVEGDSMVTAAILDGDIVLMEQRDDAPSNGRIVAAIVTQMDNEATLKRFYQEADHIRLGPANDEFPFLIIKPDDIPEEKIRTRYNSTDPKRVLKIYSGAEPQIAGWARALVREEVR